MIRGHEYNEHIKPSLINKRAFVAIFCIKMIFFTVLFACLSACLALDDQAWEDYKLQYKKVYTSETEELSRYLTWKENVDGIELHNSFYGDSYQQGEII